MKQEQFQWEKAQKIFSMFTKNENLFVKCFLTSRRRHHRHHHGEDDD